MGTCVLDGDDDNQAATTIGTPRDKPTFLSTVVLVWRRRLSDWRFFASFVALPEQVHNKTDQSAPEYCIIKRIDNFNHEDDAKPVAPGICLCNSS